MPSYSKTMIFIDGSNFYFSLKKSFNKTNIDFKKFTDFLAEDNKLVKLLYYNAPLNRKENEEEYRKQQKFFNYLTNLDFVKIYYGRLERRPDGHKSEKGVDVKLAIDLIINSYQNNFDIAVLVSNDADFIPAIKEIQKQGKKVYNVSFKNTKSYNLNKVCNYTIMVDSIDDFV